MNTNDNLTGQRFGTMTVTKLVGRNPLRWEVKCSRCGTSGTTRHEVLTQQAVRCINSSCRMQQETEGRRTGTLRKPTDYSYDPDALTIKPAKGPETFRRFREKLEAQERQQREQDEAEAQRQREEGERVIRELENQANDLHRQIAQVERERISNQRDGEAFISPNLIGIRMATDEAAENNRKEAAKFTRECPWYFRCPENYETLMAYFARNGVEVFDAAMLKRAAERLRDYGLLKERPAPEPEPVPPAPAPRAAKPKTTPPKDNRVDGWDLETGQPRKWTPFELDRLSALDYKRALRLIGDRRPILFDTRR